MKQTCAPNIISYPFVSFRAKALNVPILMTKVIWTQFFRSGFFHKNATDITKSNNWPLNCGIDLDRLNRSILVHIHIVENAKYSRLVSSYLPKYISDHRTKLEGYLIFGWKTQSCLDFTQSYPVDSKGWELPVKTFYTTTGHAFFNNAYSYTCD